MHLKLYIRKLGAVKVMQFDHLLVRYGELTLKGTNRKMFVNQLKDNVKRALIPLRGYHLKRKEG